jgi:hypothetical protein
MIAFGLGPVFFLPQAPTSSYWALSMPGVALATFDLDMSFAAAAIFITQCAEELSGRSLLVTVQNLTMAVMTSINEAIGMRVETLPTSEIGLSDIRAIWWFGLASVLAVALIIRTMVRIPKAKEKEHVR